MGNSMQPDDLFVLKEQELIREIEDSDNNEQKLTKMWAVSDPFESLLLMAAYQLKPIGILGKGLDSKVVFEYTEMARAALWRWGKSFDHQIEIDDKGEYQAGESAYILAESLMHMLYSDQLEAFNLLNEQSIKLSELSAKTRGQHEDQK